MATVKYTGPIASFHCPTDAEIRHLKVHFSPKQEGTGDPSPENVRPIVGWKGVEVHDCSKPYASTTNIPDEYKKVEYLESTGTQYIYTNVPGKSGVECKAKVSWIEGGAGDACIFGARKYASDRIMLIHQYPLQKWTIGNGNSYTGLSWIDYDVPYFVEAKTAIGEQYLKINGNTIYVGTDTTEYINNFNLSIFACTRESANNVTLFSKARVYYLTASINNNVVLNVIPCIRKSDNKPGMYDTVSQTFLTNAGTGEFLYGPEINGFDTNYQFGALGKNKFDKSAVSTYKRINMSGEIVAQSGMSISDYIPVYPNLQYTITTAEGIEGNKRHAYYDENKSFLRILPEDPTTITIPEDARYIRLTLYDSALDTTQLELGSTATAYESYNPNKTVYGGWVDLITGEVSVENVLYQIDKDTPVDRFGAPVSVYKAVYNLPYIGANANAICCNKFRLRERSSASSNYPAQNAVCCLPYNDVTNRAEFGLPNGIVSQQDWIDWLTVNGVIEIIYPLATPVTYQLHSTELSTFLGQNNVWSNADYVEVEYDLHETQTILHRKQYILANQPHIVTIQDKLVNFKTDLAAPLKSCKVYFTPVQEGTGDPSPDNVRAINGWDGCRLYTANQNMIDLDNAALQSGTGGYVYPVPNSWVTAEKTDNGFVGTVSSSSVGCGLIATYVNAGIQYTLNWSRPNDAGRCYHFIYSIDEITEKIAESPLILERIINGQYINGPYTFTPTKSGYLSLGHHLNATGTTGLSNLSLEYGSTSGEYVAPNTQRRDISWSDSAGTIYGGYVDLLAGELIETHKIFTYNDIESLMWRGLGTVGTDLRYDILIVALNLSNISMFNIFPKRTDGNRTFGTYDLYYTQSLVFNDINGEFENVDAFKTWYRENDVKFIGELSTPIIYTLTPTQLKSLKGINNIWSNANGNIEVSYWTH